MGPFRSGGLAGTGWGFTALGAGAGAAWFPNSEFKGLEDARGFTGVDARAGSGTSAGGGLDWADEEVLAGGDVPKPFTEPLDGFGPDEYADTGRCG